METGDRAAGSGASDREVEPAAADHLGSGERFVPELHRGTSLEPEHHARYRWAAPAVAGRAVLDAGCGVGWGTALLAERAAAATGVDISPLAISEARRRHGNAAEFAEGDLCRLPFADAAFDAVVSFEAIEHVVDVDAAFDEMRRVLRPGGLLVVSSPNRGVYPAGNPFHVRELTSEELAESLATRFANVVLLRQQTYVATLLGSDAQLELDDPARPVDAAISKLTGGTPGSELYTVALASDGELPALGSFLALGGQFDREEHLRMVEPWRARAERAEIDLAKARTLARHAARRIAELEGRTGGKA
jgi:SAM-dependent methyltransferase